MVDWKRWHHKITAQRGPAPRSCTGPHTQVLHWAPHLLGPALHPGTPFFQHLHLWPANHRLQKVGCADDLATMHADGDWQRVKEVQSKGMATVGEYLQTWKLNLSTTKAVLAVFTSTTRKLNVSWKSSTTMKPCPFAPSPDTSEECSTGRSHTTDTSRHFAKSWHHHHALQSWGNLLVPAGVLEQQRCKQPPCPGSCNSILLRSCLVQECSHRMAYAENFHGGGSFICIWWSFVFGVRCLWRHNLTSYSCFETKFVDVIGTFFYYHSPYFYKKSSPIHFLYNEVFVTCKAQVGV